jgi:aryl-alcohol dehydrogenase-like predicted oxidoreductase
MSNFYNLSFTFQKGSFQKKFNDQKSQRISFTKKSIQSHPGSTKIFGSDNPDLAEEIITTAYDNGINHFDVSDPFQAGRSEQELGRILRKKGWPRRNYYVSTRIYWHK